MDTRRAQDVGPGPGDVLVEGLDDEAAVDTGVWGAEVPLTVEEREGDGGEDDGGEDDGGEDDENDAVGEPMGAGGRDSGGVVPQPTITATLRRAAGHATWIRLVTSAPPFLARPGPDSAEPGWQR